MSYTTSKSLWESLSEEDRKRLKAQAERNAAKHFFNMSRQHERQILSNSMSDLKKKSRAIGINAKDFENPDDAVREVLGEADYNAALNNQMPQAFMYEKLMKYFMDDKASQEKQKSSEPVKKLDTEYTPDNDTEGVSPADAPYNSPTYKRDWMHQSEDDPDNWEYDDDDGAAEDELHETSEADELDTNDLNNDDFKMNAAAIDSAYEGNDDESAVSYDEAQSFLDSLSDQIKKQNEDDDTMQEIIKAIRPRFGV